MRAGAAEGTGRKAEAETTHATGIIVFSILSLARCKCALLYIHDTHCNLKNSFRLELKKSSKKNQKVILRVDLNLGTAICWPEGTDRQIVTDRGGGEQINRSSRSRVPV
jgi:hypothetical protein